jgi:Kef-type K+ transport system membrane component KefB
VKKLIPLYVLLVGLPVLAIWGVLRAGWSLPIPAGNAVAGALRQPEATPAETPGLLLLQIGVVLLSSRLLGWAFRAIHQPQVVGEMAAGLMLGPSLLGALAPGVSAFLFPAGSLGHLHALSQVGLVAFMFLVGHELDPGLMEGRGEATVLTSHASITLPFFLGTLLALYLYPRFADPHVSFTSFALFVGIAMSITAFPVLARILTERKLLQHPVGAVALACAAVDDVTAWCLLAAVVVAVRASAATVPLWATITGSLVFAAVMLFVVRPLLRPLEAQFRQRGRVTHNLLGLILLLVLASAWTTERLGIHALFGAFVLGAVMPKAPDFAAAVRDKLEDLTVVLLLPLFFAYMGLKTQIGLVSGAGAWLACGLVIAVAIAGKLGGSLLAARLAGISWRQATAIGILMNTRGLMQLVVLNVGLELGVVTPTVFAMMMVMALVTTIMTSPLLALVYPASRIESESRAQAVAETPALA